jgi:hypothetical protein
VTRTRALLAAVAVVACLSSACGSGGDGELQAAPPKVGTELVPPSLAGGSLVLVEDGKAKEAFGKLPENALVADGRLYAIRQGDRLVATLQLSTLLPEVDLTDTNRYKEIADELLPGTKEELEVGGLKVLQVPGEDKVVFLWFGRQMFQVLQVKGSRVDPEAVLAEVIGYQQASPAWEPLPAVDENDEEA